MLLTIITRTYKRPMALSICKTSVRQQGFPDDIQHMILEDTIGIGIAESYRQLSQRDWSDVKGDYVYLLDDDNILTPGVVQYLKDMSSCSPALIIARADMAHMGLLPPDVRDVPRQGYIDLGCVIARKDIFLKAIKHCRPRYEGDFDYISAAYQSSDRTIWFDHTIMKVQKISHGAPEAL